MDKIIRFIKNDLFRAALIFCAIEFSFALLVELSDISGSLTLWGMLELFAFSLVISCGLRLFSVKGLTFLLSLLLHYGISLFSAYVIFCIFGGIKNVVGMILLVTSVYVLVAAITLIIRRITVKSSKASEQKKKVKKDVYHRQFK